MRGMTCARVAAEPSCLSKFSDLDDIASLAVPTLGSKISADQCAAVHLEQADLQGSQSFGRDHMQKD
jgi:hypothetical protein